jgi:hypothetical protein|tara:strand:+ start:974 stop:1204 length:231 start_codon:yes stop_codon:yes gene_type:complete
MGTIPATGTEVSMGRISRALGTTSATYPPAAGSNIKLNGTLGINRSNATTFIPNIVSGSETQESEDFGGLDTPNTY